MAETPLVQSLLRGLDLLALVAESPEGVSLRDLAERAGLKSPTTHKLIRTLASKGFLERATRPVRYRLGPATLQIADAHWRSALLRRAPAVLESVSRRVESATVTLSQAVGGEVMTLLRIAPERPNWIERHANRVMHPYFTASALVFQAWWTAEERAAYRRTHPFWELGAHIWESEERLDAFLAEVREAGYAAPEFETKGVCPVAAPVFSRKGGLRAAVGASVPTGNADASTRARLIIEATRAAAELVGSDDPPVTPSGETP